MASHSTPALDRGSAVGAGATKPATPASNAATRLKWAKKYRPKRGGDDSEHIQYPQHLLGGDDADEDVTAPTGATRPQLMHLNQSMLSLIQAAGSKKDFHSQFDESSGSDTEEEGGPATAAAATASSRPRHSAEEGRDGRDSGATPSSERPSRETSRPVPALLATQPEKRLSAQRRLLPKLSVRSKRERNYMSHSMILPPRGERDSLGAESPNTPRHAPVMTRMLEAQAQLTRSPELTPEAAQSLEDVAEGKLDHLDESLEMRLQEIFGFDAAEDVLAEYPVWLLQSVLLQGYMYITSKHVAFYAYLPKRSAVVAKSGYLAKRGKQNPKFNRYWFTLKGDVLSYYLDPSDLYFPSGNIDLRYGIAAALVDSSKDKSKETHFNVSTHQRTYCFRADSPASAREWVKTLQKVIFRSHNDGDSVKISLPISNIIDIEESPVVEFAETVKIRVIDSDETYAIDEYFFSFFSFGKDALHVLRSLLEASATADKDPQIDRREPASPAAPARKQNSPLTRNVHDHVRATLSPPGTPLLGQSPRASGEWSRSSFDASGRKSIDPRGIDVGKLEVRKRTGLSPAAPYDRRRSFEDRGRRSLSTSKEDRQNRTATQSPASKHLTSSDSYVQSLDPSGTNGSEASASQILARSDVFRAPTLHQKIDSVDAGSRSRTRDQGSAAEPSSSRPAASTTRGTRPTLDAEDAIGDVDGLGQTEQSSSLQELVKGSFPLKKAAGFAGYLRKNSKKMSSLLASESMGYVEKVSGMWQGGRKHYADGTKPEVSGPEDELVEDENITGHGNRFRAHFALPDTEKLQATYFGFLHRVLPLYGKIYIGDRHFCFRSLLPGTKTRLILPLSHIENVTKERGFSGIRYAGLVIVIQAFEELFFEFSQAGVRDDCTITLLQSIDSVRYLKDAGLLSKEDTPSAELAKLEHKALQEARRRAGDEHDLKMPQSTDSVANPGEGPTILFDDPRASIINFKPTESLRITCLTIGSRGDVQPYIALCKGLLKDGHRPRIATHAEFEPWVRKHGIDFAPVEGDPAELMRICIENGMFTYSFLKEASMKFRGWIDELLSSAWQACQGSDLLVESPSAMGGIHIAEALGIPYFRAFTMPWTRTRAYPHAFAVPERKMGGAYNYMTYVMFDNVFWQAIAGQVNRWRKRELGLRSTNLDKMHPNKVPFLYNFSPSVVVPPLDYSDWIRVTGYWFLDEAEGWQPPADLVEFIAKARRDGKKLVYIGFGSIVVSDPAALTRTVIESVLKADVRCILSKGWSDRLVDASAVGGAGGAAGTAVTKPAEVPLPPEIHQIKSAPHDWLFQQIDAAAHHGGAGTTGASLRAGVPTIIKPFFGDQFFFGSRVEDLGVGICMKKLNVSVFSRAIWEATNSQRMIVKAKMLGEAIRSVRGPAASNFHVLSISNSLIGRRRRHSHPGDLQGHGVRQDADQEQTAQVRRSRALGRR